MTHQDELADMMRADFSEKVDIPADFEYLPADELAELAGLSGRLEGFGFSNGGSVSKLDAGLLVYVNTAGLPAEYHVIALRPEVGTVAESTTHETTEAARIASAYMRGQFDA